MTKRLHVKTRRQGRKVRAAFSYTYPLLFICHSPWYKHVVKQNKTHIIVIVGPTASGKTGLAVELARRLGGEIISADSRQVYKGLDIGTEKVTRREMRGVPHHCIDIASPKRAFSAAQWVTHAQKAIDTIVKKNKIPIIAGGTGFYIDALVYGTDFPAVKPDATLRKTLEKKAPQELLVMLKKLDPARAKTVEQKNPRRLIRAIEIATTLGKVPTLKKHVPRYDVTWIGLDPGHTELEARIESRLKKTLKRGLVAETKKIRASGLSWKRINELGLEYRIVASFLRDEINRTTLETLLVRELKKYVKRQRTWFKRNKEIPWFTNPDQALSEFHEIHSRHR